MTQLVGSYYNCLTTPHYTAALQLTLHSKQQHKQSGKLSSSQEVAMKSAIHRHSTDASICCPKKATQNMFSKL